MNSNKEKLLGLLEKNNKWMSSAQLATLLNVSSRTVKNYIKDINEIEKIIDSSNQGYKLVVDNSINSGTKVNIQNLIISKLLILDQEPISLYNLSTHFYYSEQQMKRLLDEVANRLSNNNLVLYRGKNNYIIKGTERNKRKLQSELIYSEAQSNYIDEKLISSYFPNIDGIWLKRQISQELDKHKIFANEFVINSIMLHFSILILRYNNRETNYKIESTLSKEFINAIEAKFDIKINQETADIISELFGIESKTNVVVKVTNEELDVFFKDVQCFIPTKFETSEIRSRMKLHIENFIQRSQKNKLQKNPMKKLLKMRSPLIYEASYYAMTHFCEKKQIEFSDDEVAFIAIHIGMEVQYQSETNNKIPAVLFCPQYFGLSKEIKRSVEQRYGNDIYIYKITEKREDIESEEGILISLLDVTLKNKYKVVISPMLVESDIEQIGDIISKYKRDTKKIKLYSLLNKLTDPNYFFHENKAIDKKEVLSLLTNKLIDNGIVDEQFEKDVEEREELSSTAFNLVAIPHALQYSAEESKLVVYINKCPIEWEKDTVHMVFLLVTKNEEKKVFVDLFEVLSNFFEDTDLQIKLMECNTLEDFIEKFTKGIK